MVPIVGETSSWRDLGADATPWRHSATAEQTDSERCRPTAMMILRFVAGVSVLALTAVVTSCGGATSDPISTEWSLDFSDSPAVAFGTLDDAAVLELVGATDSPYITSESEMSVNAGDYLTVRYAPTPEGSARVQWPIAPVRATIHHLHRLRRFRRDCRTD